MVEFECCELVVYEVFDCFDVVLCDGFFFGELVDFGLIEVVV